MRNPLSFNRSCSVPFLNPGRYSAGSWSFSVSWNPECILAVTHILFFILYCIVWYENIRPYFPFSRVSGIYPSGRRPCLDQSRNLCLFGIFSCIYACDQASSSLESLEFFLLYFSEGEMFLLHHVYYQYAHVHSNVTCQFYPSFSKTLWMYLFHGTTELASKLDKEVFFCKFLENKIPAPPIFQQH